MGDLSFDDAPSRGHDLKHSPRGGCGRLHSGCPLTGARLETSRTYSVAVTYGMPPHGGTT